MAISHQDNEVLFMVFPNRVLVYLMDKIVKTCFLPMKLYDHSILLENPAIIEV